jgi:hypothetical protein
MFDQVAADLRDKTDPVRQWPFGLIEVCEIPTDSSRRLQERYTGILKGQAKGLGGG